MEMRALAESVLFKDAHPSREGLWTSRGQLARSLALVLFCPEHEAGYRWSATSNYLRACLRALDRGLERPSSRSRQLSADERDLIWQAAQTARGLWDELLAELGIPSNDPRVGGVLIDFLAQSSVGRRLLAPKQRSRLSPLAA